MSLLFLSLVSLHLPYPSSSPSLLACLVTSHLFHYSTLLQLFSHTWLFVFFEWYIRGLTTSGEKEQKQNVLSKHFKYNWEHFQKLDNQYPWEHDSRKFKHVSLNITSYIVCYYYFLDTKLTNSFCSSTKFHD